MLQSKKVIQVISDIHFDYNILKTPKIHPSTDILVLPGDISSASFQSIFRVFTFLERALIIHPKMSIVYVPGNHELKNFDASKQKYNHLLSEWRTSLNNLSPRIHFLHNGKITLNQIEFYGSPLWSNLKSLTNPSNNQLFLHSKHLESVKWIKKEINMISKVSVAKTMQNTIRSKIMITHHLPSFLSINTKYNNPKYTNDKIKFGSPLDKLVSTSPFIYWFHGHTHEYCNYRLGKTKVVCNPFQSKSYKDMLLFKV